LTLFPSRPRPVNSIVRVHLKMKNRKLRLPFVVIAAYLLMVFLCILQAFNFAGAINLNWTLVVIGLTLPWSLISIVFAWSLIHGAGLEFFATMYMVFASLNSLVYYRWYSWALKRRRARSS
jgi:hypothetical protein